MGIFGKLFKKNDSAKMADIPSIPTLTATPSRPDYAPAPPQPELSDEEERMLAYAWETFESPSSTIQSLRKALLYLYQLMEKNNVDACEMISEIYRDGRKGKDWMLNPNSTKYSNALEKAAELGSISCLEELADNYARGKRSYVQSIYNAHKCFYKLTILDPSNRRFQLNYALGIYHGYPEDPFKNISTVKTIAELGDAVLQTNFFQEYNRVKAKSMIKRLASTSYPPAQKAYDTLLSFERQEIAADVVMSAMLKLIL